MACVHRPAVPHGPDVQPAVWACPLQSTSPPLLPDLPPPRSHQHLPRPTGLWAASLGAHGSTALLQLWHLLRLVCLISNAFVVSWISGFVRYMWCIYYLIFLAWLNTNTRRYPTQNPCRYLATMLPTTLLAIHDVMTARVATAPCPTSQLPM